MTFIYAGDLGIDIKTLNRHNIVQLKVIMTTIMIYRTKE